MKKDDGDEFTSTSEPSVSDSAICPESPALGESSSPDLPNPASHLSPDPKIRWGQQLRILTERSCESLHDQDLRLISEGDFHPSMMTLQDGIALTRSRPERNWDVLLIGGFHTLLSQFAHLARAFGRLQELGVPIAVIEPDSILMGSDGEFLILSHRLKSRPDLDLDQFASRIAPEILLASHEAEVQESQVVYGLAVLLHECVFGSPPWSGRDATAVADRLLSGNSVMESSEIPLGLPGLKGLLRDALSLDPNKRPSTLRGFARMLEAVRDGERPRSGSGGSGFSSSHSGKLRLGLFAALIVLATVLGRFLSSDGDFSEMTGDLEKAMLMRPLPVHGEEKPLADHATRWFQRFEQKIHGVVGNSNIQRQFAWVCLRAGEFDRAREAARRASRSQPVSPGPWIILGIAGLEMGDSGGRIEIENGLGLECTDSFDQWSQVAGHMYLLQNREALELLHVLAVQSPKDPDVWFHRAICELRTGQVSAARLSVDRYMALNPLDGWGDWLHAEIAFAEGRMRTTEKILESAQLRLNLNQALAIRTSSLWARLGRDRTALEWQKRSRDTHETWENLEWRKGGRLVLPGRSVLFLGPPGPPEKIQNTPE